MTKRATEAIWIKMRITLSLATPPTVISEAISTNNKNFLNPDFELPYFEKVALLFTYHMEPPHNLHEVFPEAHSIVEAWLRSLSSLQRRSTHEKDLTFYQKLRTMYGVYSLFVNYEIPARATQQFSQFLSQILTYAIAETYIEQLHQWNPVPSSQILRRFLQYNNTQI